MKNFLSSGGIFLACALAAQAVPVTFQLNMAYQISQGNFDPTSGTVEARGSFQSPTTWTGGFTLTNSPSDPTVYRGTYNVTAASGSNLEYKFVYDNNTGNGVQWEGRPNRTFTLESTAQTLPVVYYNDVTGPPPEVPVTFSVDMGVQVTKGNFDPNVDYVEARGAFQSPTAWTSGFTLTNSPAKPNIFTGTYVVSNTMPGSVVEYKYYAGGALGWESIANRGFIMPSSATNLPTGLFNNDVGGAIPVTFQVDMTGQVLAGKFDPAGDSVEARGSFQTPTAWTSGFTLTNNPEGSNTNLYSGTYVVSQAPGTRVEYKYWSSSSLGWESPASTGGGNRSFLLSTNAQALPVVSFNDLGVSDLLPADTLVTFRVNMTNAHAIASGSLPAFDFNPATDSVYFNAAFLNWWTWSPGNGNPDYQMTNSPGSQIYSITLLIPKGSPVGLSYKYSINGGDNEAPQDQNHYRYIRSVGTYQMPLDTFGVQFVEPSFGNLAIARPQNNSVLVSWLGRPGVHLQTSTNLLSNWQDLMQTDSASSTNYPFGGTQRFFRLVKP